MAAPVDWEVFYHAVRLIETEDAAYLDNFLVQHPLLIRVADSGANNFTLLFYAVLRGRPSHVELLLARGADIRAVTTDKLSIAHEAVKTFDCAMIKLVLSKLGAEASTTVWRGMHLVPYASRHFPLDPAMRSQALLAMTALLQHVGCVHVNERDDGNATALHWAAHHGLPELTRLLMKHGANPRVAYPDGTTPRDVAREEEEESEDHREVVRLLEVSGKRLCASLSILTLILGRCMVCECLR
jgi:ankyrin repeat protein